jgi:signal transduction histidine kinase
MRFLSSEQNHAIFGRQDAEFEQLKKERDELLTRERAARTEAEPAQRSEGDGLGRGIHSMRERTELVGGIFGLSPTLGAGTKIEASIPLDGGSERRIEPLDDFSNGGR